MNTNITVHNAGSLNIDDVFTLDRLVLPGETSSSRSMGRFAGGKGLNQSVAIARAGGRVRHSGFIGKDGLFLRELLETEGVDISGIKVIDEPTGHAIIQVADDGENAIILYGGANHSWSSTDVDRTIEAAREGDILLVQNEINVVPELINAACDAGLQVAFNPSPMPHDRTIYPFNQLTWLVVNELEGKELLGLDPRETIVHTQLAQELKTGFPGVIIVVTFGKNGAIRIDDSGLIHASVPKIGTVTDTTGAGDTFLGYLIAGEAARLNPKDGLERACAAGALAVTKKGAATGIPHIQEVKQYLLHSNLKK